MQVRNLEEDLLRYIALMLLYFFLLSLPPSFSLVVDRKCVLSRIDISFYRNVTLSQLHLRRQPCGGTEFALYIFTECASPGSFGPLYDDIVVL